MANRGRGTRGAGAILAGVLAVLGAAEARAATVDPGEILRRMDAVISGYADQEMDVTMTVVDTDGTRKSYDFTIQQKGTRQRLIRFHTGEMKGMATLVEDRDRVHVYLPGFKKIRRVAAHSMNQTFAGSDFTNDDMAATTWADEYDAVLQSEDEDRWVLRCTPRAGSRAQHPQALVTVAKGTFYQQSVEYRDEAGRTVRRLDSSDLRTFPGGAARFGNVVMTDTRTGHRTLLSITGFRVNRGLSDEAFSLRQLEWGR